MTLLGLRVTGGNGASSIDDGVGGGIYQAEGHLFLEDVSIDHNAAAPSAFDTISGGGIDSNGQELVIVDSTVADNKAVGETVPQQNQFGGGIDAEFGPAVAVLDTTIADNEAGGSGGGIAASGEATLSGATIARMQLPWSRKLSDNWTAAGQLCSVLANSRGWPQSNRRIHGSSWIGNSQNHWMRSSSMPVTFRSAVGRGTCCISAPRIRLRLDNNFDLHFGVGLSGAAIDHFIGIGYSFRFQALRR